MDELHYYFSPEKVMEMTNPYDSVHNWLTSRTKKKLSCMGEPFPFSSGGLFPSLERCLAMP